MKEDEIQALVAARDLAEQKAKDASLDLIHHMWMDLAMHVNAALISTASHKSGLGE